MNKLYFTLLLLFISSNHLFAQKMTDKIVLTKGQVIKATMEMKSESSRGEQGDMKTDMSTLTEFVVEDVTDKGYVLKVSMKKAKMMFEGFGMKQDYDSEDENKKSGMMAQGFEKALKETETMTMDFQGNMIEEDVKDKIEEGRRGGGGGMMRMMGGDISTAVSGAFLLVPANTAEGGKWRTTTEKEGLTTITEYTFNGMMGNMANITANQQVKGTVNSNRQGMAFTSEVNKLSTMTILVDATTGLISFETIEGTDKSVTKMGDKDMPSNGTSTITLSYE